MCVGFCDLTKGNLGLGDVYLDKRSLYETEMQFEGQVLNLSLHSRILMNFMCLLKAMLHRQ